MLLRVLIGVLLLLHGLVHFILAAMPNPESAEPAVATFFTGWARPWLQGTLPDGALQAVAIALAAIAGFGFIASGLAMFGVLVPHDWWRALAIASSVVSLLLCVLFWNKTLIVGPVVAVGIIVVVGVLHWPSEAALGF